MVADNRTLWPSPRSLAAAARLHGGIADAGADTTLHSAAPARRLMARAFMGHLLLLPPAAPLMAKSRSGFYVGCRTRAARERCATTLHDFARYAVAAPSIVREDGQQRRLVRNNLWQCASKLRERSPHAGVARSRPRCPKGGQ